jgi:23S rRNA pseudouridine955/2504/2580 synthase
MSGVRTVDVAQGDDGIRLDRWFKRHFPHVTQARLQKWLRTGQVRVDGGRAKAGHRLAAGQTIRVPPLGAGESPAPLPRPKVPAAEAEALVAAVLHRDDQVLAINKPPGLAVQGGTGTVLHVDAMLDALRFGADERPRLVHRLDKDTSGVLLLARTAAAAAALTAAFRSKKARKVYWAVVVGVPRPAAGRIDLALAKLPGHRGDRVAADTESGKRAITHYRIIERAGGRAAWLSMEPLTGRTHQLRAHAAALGTPILGDGKYGGRDAHFPGHEVSSRMHLHARAIRIPHPAGGILEVVAPLPEHMIATWKFLGFREKEAILFEEIDG